MGVACNMLTQSCLRVWNSNNWHNVADSTLSNIVTAPGNVDQTVTLEILETKGLMTQTRLNLIKSEVAQ